MAASRPPAAWGCIISWAGDAPRLILGLPIGETNMKFVCSHTAPSSHPETMAGQRRAHDCHDIVSRDGATPHLADVEKLYKPTVLTCGPRSFVRGLGGAGGRGGGEGEAGGQVKAFILAVAPPRSSSFTAAVLSWKEAISSPPGPLTASSGGPRATGETGTTQSWRWRMASHSQEAGRRPQEGGGNIVLEKIWFKAP